MRQRAWLAILILCSALLMSRASHAQAPEPAPAVAAATGNDAAITEYRLPPDKLAKAAALYRSRLIIFGVGTFYGLAILVAVLTLRVAPRLRDLAERVSPRRWLQVLVFAPLLILTLDTLRLPLSLYSHQLQVDYGLSVQPWSSWWLDWIKGAGIGLVFSTALIWGLYAFLQRTPQRWWLYGWAACVPFTLLLVLIYPVFIDPLFNKFEPLAARQPQLVQQLERITQRGGLSIERSRMFEMRASDKVTTYNAYVTGIGASKRVVVWDNTARDLSIAQTMFVFGHEQGHYVLNHVWMSLTLGIVGLLVGMYLAHRLIGVMLARYGARWEIRDLGDWASLPALLLLFNLFSLIGEPINSGFSRMLEHQADIYGLEVIHGLTPDSPQDAAHAFQKLGEKGLSYPHPYPLHVFWVFSHPPLADRIRFAASYRPWERGEPGRYVE